MGAGRESNHFAGGAEDMVNSERFEYVLTSLHTFRDRYMSMDACISEEIVHNTRLSSLLKFEFQ